MKELSSGTKVVNRRPETERIIIFFYTFFIYFLNADPVEVILDLANLSIERQVFVHSNLVLGLKSCLKVP